MLRRLRPRLKRWEDGERIQLWHTRRQLQRGLRRPPTTAERKEMATNLAREGFDGKACAALLATGLAAENHETTAALQALHPHHADPDLPAIHELPPTPEIVPDIVARALRSFPASAPGPSGLRVQHLHEACAPGAADSFLEQLAAVVSLLAQGQACSEAAASWLGPAWSRCPNL